MPRYSKAPAEAEQTIERMRDRYHPQIRDAGVTITCLFAFPLTDENGDSKGPALKFQGYPAQAVVKIIGLKERTDGRADAEIVVDGDNWPTLSDKEKDALIDHELEHLELKYDKDGLLVRDDLDRPKLIIRKHDVQAGWFDSIVRRHGRASPELRQYEKFKEVHYEQRWLPYLDKPDTTPVEATPINEATKGDGEGLPASSDGTVTVLDHGKPVKVAKEDVGSYIVSRAKDTFAKERKAGGKRAFAGKPSKSRRKAAAR